MLALILFFVCAVQGWYGARFTTVLWTCGVGLVAALLLRNLDPNPPQLAGWFTLMAMLCGAAALGGWMLGGGIRGKRPEA